MKVINVVMSGSGTIPELGTLDIPNSNSDILLSLFNKKNTTK